MFHYVEYVYCPQHPRQLKYIPASWWDVRWFSYKLRGAYTAETKYLPNESFWIVPVFDNAEYWS